MQEVFKFFQENWSFVVEVLIASAVLVLTAIKRRSVSSIFSELYYWCIAAVKLAEKTNLKGQAKLDYCLEILDSMISTEYPKLGINNYKTICVSMIENILSTPQKKGE